MNHRQLERLGQWRIVTSQSKPALPPTQGKPRADMRGTLRGVQTYGRQPGMFQAYWDKMTGRFKPKASFCYVKKPGEKRRIFYGWAARRMPTGPR